MSLAATVWAWRQNTHGTTALIVLLRIADRVWDDGLCWDSHADIARSCQLSPRAVYDALKSLETGGLITRTKRSNGKQRLTDKIQVNLTRVVLFEDGPMTELASRIDTESASSVSEEEAGSAPNSHLAQNGAERAATHIPLRDTVKSTVEPAHAQEPDDEQRPARQDHGSANGLDVIAARIFDAGTDKHRSKCQDDPRKIMFALRDAQERGDDPNQVAEAMVACLTSGDQLKADGRYAINPARYIDDNRWKIWIGRAASAPASRDLDLTVAPITEIEFDGHVYAVPPGGQSHRIGSYDLPGVQRQIAIMDRWETRRLHDWDGGKWGPAPGSEGCRLWPSVLERYRYEGKPA